jgi:hypothetical protein
MFSIDLFAVCKRIIISNFENQDFMNVVSVIVIVGYGFGPNVASFQICSVHRSCPVRAVRPGNFFGHGK